MKRIWRTRSGGIILVLIGIFLLLVANIALNLPWFIFRTDEIPDKKLAITRGIDLTGENKKILVVAAHPDDLECFIGGTLAALKKQDAEVTVVILADKGPDPDVKNKELASASKTLGFKKIIYLGYADSGLKDIEVEELEIRLGEIYKQNNPDAVLAFDPLYQNWIYKPVDHAISGTAAVSAANETGIPHVYLFFTSKPDTSVDIHNALTDKYKAVSAVKSRFGLIPAFILRFYIEKTARVEGSKSGLAYGESFRKLK